MIQIFTKLIQWRIRSWFIMAGQVNFLVRNLLKKTAKEVIEIFQLVAKAPDRFDNFDLRIRIQCLKSLKRCNAHNSCS